MAITQRPNNLQLPPEAMATRQAERQAERQVEQAERRFDVETPAWGGIHPVSGEWEQPDRAIGRGATTGFWERSPENWGIVHRHPGPGMADWAAVIPKFPERKRSSGLDPYTMKAVRTVGAGAVRAARLANVAATPRPPAPRLPTGRKTGPGRYTAANGTAAAYNVPGRASR